MNISLAWAVDHFEEANGFMNGGSNTIAVDSDIRRLAEQIWGHSYSHLMSFVCNEIFRVIAEDAYQRLWSAKVVTT